VARSIDGDQLQIDRWSITMLVVAGVLAIVVRQAILPWGERSVPWTKEENP
jgi:hypothetical protein